ncbi:hypothetical protein Ancab_031125 [Ancistrocladus abbreviatus]
MLRGADLRRLLRCHLHHNHHHRTTPHCHPLNTPTSTFPTIASNSLNASQNPTISPANSALSSRPSDVEIRKYIGYFFLLVTSGVAPYCFFQNFASIREQQSGGIIKDSVALAFVFKRQLVELICGRKY